MSPLATITQQYWWVFLEITICIVSYGTLIFTWALSLAGRSEDMGSAISKKCKHKGKLEDKETWTGEEGDGQELVVDITTADAGNQCVLQWIQKITSGGTFCKNIDH